jgi:hypothetical protein
VYITIPVVGLIPVAPLVTAVTMVTAVGTIVPSLSTSFAMTLISTGVSLSVVAVSSLATGGEF